MVSTRALAPTTFVAGPQEDLATPDVYEIQSDAVINKLPIPAAIADVSDITGELRGGKSMLDNLPMLTRADAMGASEAIRRSSEGLKFIENGIYNESTGRWASDLKGKVAGAVKGDGGGFLDSVKNFGSTMSKALGGVKGITALSKMSGPDLVSRLANGSLSGIPGLGNSALASAAATLRNNALPDEVKRLFNTPIPSSLGTFGTVGNQLTKLLPGKITQSYQMTSIINGLVSAPVNGIVDKDGTSRLIAGLTMGGMSAGVNNSFSALAPLANNDVQILLSAAQAGAKYASSTGNVAGLKDVVNTIGSQRLTSIGKSLVKSLSSGYQPSQESTVSTKDQVDDFHDIKDTFDMIDPGWMREDRYTVNPETNLPVMQFPVSDISMVAEGSSDFMNTMVVGAVKSNDSEDKFLAVAAVTPQRSPEEELKINFPMTVTSVKTNTKPSNTTDSNGPPDYTKMTDNQRAKAAAAEYDSNFMISMRYKTKKDYVDAVLNGLGWRYSAH